MEQSFLVITNGVSGGWAMEQRRLLRMVVRSDTMRIQWNYCLVHHDQLREAGIVYL
jgi:hypothetical protein